MDTILRQAGLTRASDAPAVGAPWPVGSTIARAIRRLLLSMAQITVERLLLVQREPPPSEWYRFPLP